MTVFDIDILTGLKPIAAVYLGFAIVYLLNMMGGIIINCQITKEETFSFGKLFLSFEKVIFCGITLGGLVISTNLVTQGLFTINNELTEIVTSVISLGIFALVFAKGFIQKALDLVSKIKYLFEITDTSEQTNLDNINSLALENLNNYIDTATEPGNPEPLG